MKVGNRVNKNGGNVASHFLTPNGRVIHSVTGPVSARVLIDEAKFAIALYAEAKTKTYHNRLKHIAITHQQASLSPVSNQDRKVHELLALNPLPRLQDVYQEIFERILGQRVSKAGPRLAQAAAKIELAKKTGRPMLFVLHEQGWAIPHLSPLTHQLLNEFVVIAIPLKEAPALSQLTGQPPYEGNRGSRRLFVVARSDCRQLRSVSGWDPHQFNAALADGWVDALQRKPPSVRTLVRAQRILRKIDANAADRIRELTIRVQEESRNARAASRAKLTKSVAATVSAS